MYHAYKTFRSVIWVIAGVMLLFFAARHYLRSREDTAPLAVKAADVPAVAGDHHWLAVTGRLVAASAVERTFHGKYGDTYSIYIPLVPPTWDSSQSVHAIALFDGRTRDDAMRVARAALSAGGGGNFRATVTGTQDDFGRPDLFASLHVADDAILIRQGNTPVSGGQMLWMAGLGIVGIAAGGFRLMRVGAAGAES
jgi:hypothetical protein